MDFFNNKTIKQTFDKEKLIKKGIVFVSFLIFVFILVYAVSDMLTSRQTYHLDEPNRILCKVSLIAINFSAFASILLMFFYKKQSFIELIKKNILFVLSLVGICFCIFISFLIHKQSVSLFFTALIYPVSILVISIWFASLIKFDLLPKIILKFCLLILFYLYLFFCLFFYFYVLGKPMSSGGLRIPVISHVFFCCSLLPILRIFLNKKEMLIVYISFFPIMFLSDKSSVLIIFLIYVISDLYQTYIKNFREKLFIVLISLFFIGLVGLLILSNVWKDSFLYNHLSFYSVVIKSGRLQNWSAILGDLKNFTALDYLFGKGIGATLLCNNGTAAHNDYIEFFYDYGIIGLLLLLFFVFSLIFKIKTSKNDNEKQSSLLLFIYVFIITMISSLFSNNNLLLSFSLIHNNRLEREASNEEKKYWDIII